MSWGTMTIATILLYFNSDLGNHGHCCRIIHQQCVYQVPWAAMVISMIYDISMVTMAVIAVNNSISTVYLLGDVVNNG